MITRVFYITILSLLFFVFGITSPLHAQLNDGGDISFGLIPANPRPNQNVSVTIESYSINLDSSRIKWYVNGKLITEGNGIKKILTKTGDLGSQTTIVIEVLNGAETLTKTINIIPASVNILWEAQTYTPPFFKGKALFSHQSNIKFVATPTIMSNGQIIPKEELVYTWSKNGTILGDQSGYGLYTLGISGSVISRPISIDVTVQDPKTGISAFATIDVTPQDPEVLTYIVDPLYGVQYNKLIKGTLPLNGKEVTLTAVPYYFSNAVTTDDAVSYNWSINGNTISDRQNIRTRVFRKVGEVFGVSNIGLQVIQGNKLLQFASFNLAIDFLNDSQ